MTEGRAKSSFDWRKLEMPLLLRELRQQAAAERTYIIRFTYAATLFVISLWLFYGTSPATDVSELGRGRWMFRQLVLVQFWAIVVLVPVTTCSVITIEKERNALGVLLLTPLGSFRIVLQKLLSRLIPMFSFILLSLPLMAVAFSHGGVTTTQLVFGIILLFLTSAQMGALSIMCSVWTRTTPEAMATTIITFLLSWLIARPFWLDFWLTSDIATGSPDTSPVAACLISCFLTAVMLAIASTSLVSRAFLTPRNVILELFQWLDGFFNEANKMTGGIVLVKDRQSTPRNKPVTWRETDRRSLGTFRYLFRILVALEMPVILLVVFQERQYLDRGLKTMLVVNWVVSALLISVQAAGLIAAERSRQTLDVLLTTPLSGRSILLQKGSGVWRMLAVLTIPFLTVNLILANTQVEFPEGFVFWSLLGVVTTLSAIAWFAIWMSTRVRSQLRAILETVICLLLAVLVPRVVLQLAATQMSISSELTAWLTVFSPVDVISAVHGFGIEAVTVQWPVYAVHYGLVALVAVLFRLQALRGIDRRLGRLPEGFKIDKQRIPKEALESTTAP